MDIKKLTTEQVFILPENIFTNVVILIKIGKKIMSQSIVGVNVLNYHDTIIAFFLKSADQYLAGWQENKTPPYPMMKMLKRNKEDNLYQIAYAPLEIPGGIPDGIDPMVLVKPILDSFTPDAYMIMSEVWTVRADKLEKSPANLKVGDMEYMKGREEKLLIFGKSIDDKAHFTETYLIKRDHRTMKKWLIADPKMKLFSNKLP